jgi:hypothetical protein
MIKNFKSVIFFGKGNVDLTPVTQAFRSISFIKCFQTQSSDELAQIIAQSEQCVIFLWRFDEVTDISAQRILHQTSTQFKIYYLDEAGDLSNSIVEELSAAGISTIRFPTHKDLEEKCAILFLGKIMHHEHDATRPVEFEKAGQRKSYFSHFEMKNGAWQLLASTHDQDPDIETIFSLSWTLYREKLLRRAHELKEFEEDVFFSDNYTVIVYPHDNGGNKKLSIIHLRKDPVLYETLRAKALIFLRKI